MADECLSSMFVVEVYGESGRTDMWYGRRVRFCDRLGRFLFIAFIVLTSVA